MKKLKTFIKENKEELIVGGILIAMGMTCYGLGIKAGRAGWTDLRKVSSITWKDSGEGRLAVEEVLELIKNNVDTDNMYAIFHEKPNEFVAIALNGTKVLW